MHMIADVIARVRMAYALADKPLISVKAPDAEPLRYTQPRTWENIN